MAPTRRNWLSKNVKQCEALLEELYRERDARTNWELRPTQLEEQLVNLHRSVAARRRYEAKVRDDPAWVERHRARAREGYHRRKQAQAQQAQVEERRVGFTVDFS